MNSTTNASISIDIFNYTKSSISIYHQKIIRSLFLILCMFGGLVINVLFIVIIVKSKKFRRRSLFGLCINLSCIFFLDIIINQLFTVISSIYEKWIFNEVTCILQSFCIILVDTCLSLTLFMLGIDRLITIQANVNDKTKLSKGLNASTICASIFCLWFVSICFSIPLATKTINSTYLNYKYSCGPSLNDNTIIKFSFLCLTIALPMICVAIIYMHIAKVWQKAKQEIRNVSLSYTLTDKFQIEKEVNNSLCTFVFHFIWVLFVGPYIVWLYIPEIPVDATVVLVLLRNFYCWLPFLIAVICHRSFRKNLKYLIIANRNHSNSSNIFPNSDINDNSNQTGTIATNSQQHTYSTNVAFDNNENLYSNYDSENGNSSPSLSVSCTSSAISIERIERIPKVPIMFATVKGVHIINEYSSELSNSNDEESHFPATLCDVNEPGFTDTSDAASMTTNNSIKKHRLSNPINDVKLPADIIDTLNPDGLIHKRLKRLPQSNPQIKASLESAFELPNISPKKKVSVAKENTPKKLKKKKRRAPAVPMNYLPELFEANISPVANLEHNNSKSNEFEIDFNSASNA